MSNRKNAFKSESNNPSTRFLEWKSEEQCFAYYDKDKKKNVLVPLPLKFVTLQEMHTVKGWHDASSSGIYANEVKSVAKDYLSVKAFKGGAIAEGLYKDIKSRITSEGGHYAKSIYAMSEEGEIINISLKGSGVQRWGDFTQKCKNRLPDEWIVVGGAEEMKKGRVSYSVPKFDFNGSLDADEGVAADECFDALEAYLDGYKETIVIEEEDADIPF